MSPPMCSLSGDSVTEAEFLCLDSETVVGRESGDLTEQARFSQKGDLPAATLGGSVQDWWMSGVGYHTRTVLVIAPEQDEERWEHSR